MSTPAMQAISARPPARPPARPSHDEVATFLATYLPAAPRPRDVDFFYHVPRQYMRPQPAPPDTPFTLQPTTVTTQTGASAVPSALQTHVPIIVPQTQPPPPPPPAPFPHLHNLPPKNTTPVSHITLSITPTPGFYTSLLTPPSPSPFPSPLFSRPAAAPLAFIHRPWTLDRRATPRGTSVVASHTGFDETLTVGWNVHLAARLGVDVGRVREGGGGGGEQEEGGWRCVCLKGYKGDEERRIGLVGGVVGGGGGVVGALRERSFGRGRLRGESEGKEEVEEEEEEEDGDGDGDGDGGVLLDAAANSATAEAAVAVATDFDARSNSAVNLKEMLARIAQEFPDVGEVFDFSSSLYHAAAPSATTESQPSLPNPISNAAAPSAALPSSAPPVASTTIAAAAAPPATGAPPSAPTTTPNTTPTTTPAAPPPPHAPKAKRQKKAKPPPPPPIPPSIPLSSATRNPLVSDTPITAVAIMNAFHAEEVERAIAAAFAGGWIGWTGVGAAELGGGGEGGREGDVDVVQVQEDGAASSPPPRPAHHHRQSQSLSRSRSPSQRQRQSQSRLLFLTGAPRAPGLAHVQKHYADSIKVVCVGHEACEEWGVKFLAEECGRRWPGVLVRAVLEKEEEGRKV